MCGGIKGVQPAQEGTLRTVRIAQCLNLVSADSEHGRARDAWVATRQHDTRPQVRHWCLGATGRLGSPPDLEID